MHRNHDIAYVLHDRCRGCTIHYNTTAIMCVTGCFRIMFIFSNISLDTFKQF